MKKSESQKSAAKNEYAQKTDRDDFLIVGIGASAGGIRALKEFFENVPADFGAAYVAILHLSPDRDSRLAGVLQAVSKIPVTQVTEQVKVEPNRVYVVPPNQHLTMIDGFIAVSPIKTVEERRAPVDIFFRTLGDSHGSRAVAVILSGTGANGSMGLKRVKERGGVCFVQNPREAEFSEMPRNSIATGLVDAVLNVADIPARIIAYKASIETVEIPALPESRPDEQQAALREIFTQLRLGTGHDFSNYKRPTLLRRIERRINVHALRDLPSYAALIKENPEEATALMKNLLISVTNFFRDKEVFDFLEADVLPKICYGKTSADRIRVWVAGCATGEEAYSVAMLLSERATYALDPPAVQIFATDIDERAIAAAREGFYTASDAADVSPERLRRFFTKENDGYRVRRELREMVLFANHNVLKDPPFSHLDLVTCRNMLIYLNRAAQERVMEIFHFALEPGGYLLLGNSETTDGADDLYAQISREHHVYQSRQASQQRIPPYPVADTSALLLFDKTLEKTYAAPQKRQKTSSERKTRSLERISFDELHLRLLEQYAPSIVVNEEYDIVHLSESATRFLRIKGGEPTQNLLKLIRQRLRLELRNALFQAVERQTNVEVKNLKIKIDDREEVIDICVRPVKYLSGDTTCGFVLVLFEPAREGAEGAARQTVYSSAEPVASQLEQELIRLREQLRLAVEQYEVQAEELKASNEELQAMNEEMRSAGEELETGKEELQSTNEELITVNQELKVKIEELSQSNNDFQNLINSTDIATVFLDRSFRVNTFTPAASRIFNLIPADFGRPISDITHRLETDGLIHDAETVLETLQTVEREARTNDGRTYLLRVLPYRTNEDRINGVVASFIDITERKRAEEKLRQSEARQAYLLKLSDAIRPLSDAAQIMETVARTTMNYFKADRCYYVEIEGDVATIRRDARREDLPSVANVYSLSETPLFKSVSQNGQPIVVQDVNTSDVMDESLKRLCLSVGIFSYINVPVIKDNRLVGNFCLTQSAARDWTNVEVDFAKETAERAWAAVERARAEEALAESEERLRLLIESVSDYAIFTLTPDNLIESWNTGAEKVFGWTEKEVLGKSGEIIFTPEDRAKGEPEKEIETALRNARAPDGRFHLRKDGSRFYASGVMTLLKVAGGRVRGFVKIARDMTERLEAEKALRDKEVLQKLVGAQEDERKRIARDLHDELGQQLTALRLKLNAARKLCEDDTELCGKIDEIEMLAKRTDEGVDFLAWELRPAALDDLGLVAALKNYVKQWSYHSGVTAELIANRIKRTRFAPEVETNLYRIVQEALNNVHKHAKAKSAEVALEKRDDLAVLIIEDDGVGFKPEDKLSRSKGMGLTGMKERAQLVGGELEIESAPGSGTTIYVRVPVSSAKKRDSDGE